MIKKVFIKIFTLSFHIFESPVIYIVEGHEKPAVLIEAAPYISKLRIGNERTRQGTSRKWYRFSPSLFSGNGKTQCKLKNSREIQDLNIYRGRNDGRLGGSTDSFTESAFIKPRFPFTPN